MTVEYPEYYEHFTLPADDPRVVTTVGEYEQIHLPLSCPEAADLFFASPKHFALARTKDSRPGTWLSVEDSANLEEILAFRDTAIGGCQEGSSSKHFAHLFSSDTDGTWAQEFVRTESAEPGWSELTRRIAENYASYEANWPEVYNEELEQWFRKLGAYFSFRFYLDSWVDGALIAEKLIIKKSLWFLRLMCVDRWLQNGKTLETADLKELAREYSASIESSENNMKILKELD